MSVWAECVSVCVWEYKWRLSWFTNAIQYILNNKHPNLYCWIIDPFSCLIWGLRGIISCPLVLGILLTINWVCLYHIPLLSILSSTVGCGWWQLLPRPFSLLCLSLCSTEAAWASGVADKLLLWPPSEQIFKAKLDCFTQEGEIQTNCSQMRNSKYWSFLNFRWSVYFFPFICNLLIFTDDFIEGFPHYCPLYCIQFTDPRDLLWLWKASKPKIIFTKIL